jgi:lipopolysaccharide export system permease protein
MLVFKYIALHYVRYFLIILFALTLFVVGFDYLGGSEKLDISANLLIVYLIYKGLFAIDTLMPLFLFLLLLLPRCICQNKCLGFVLYLGILSQI